MIPTTGAPFAAQRLHVHHVLAPGQTEEQFESQQASRLREFENLKRRFC
jgi:hypothetical protein